MIAFLILAVAAIADSQFTGGPTRTQELFPPFQSAPAKFTSFSGPASSPSFAPAFAPPPAPAFNPAPAPAFAPPPAPAFNPAPAPISSFTPPGTFAAPATSRVVQPIGIVHSSYQQDDHGQFTSSVSQTNGAQFQETGELHPTNDHKDQVIVKKGFYRYISPNGVPVEVHYIADEYGFHPQGSVIPK